MRADRLATVLRVRELAERRRLAERAAAAREVEARRAEHATALVARSQAIPPSGASMAPDALGTLRLGAIALDDAVERAAGQEQQASQRSTSAERALTEAAIERRSAERLRDRRERAAARLEQRAESRREDDVALQQWRSRP